MADIWSNLALRWAFDENTGSSANDSSGNSLTGTLNSTPTWVAGKIGLSALQFSGTNNVTRASFQVPATGSVAFWHKPAVAFNSSTDVVIFDVVSGGTFFRFQKYSDNNFYCGFFDGSEHRVSLAASAGNWPNGTWAHYCLTWTSGGSTTLYCNGSSIGTNAVAVPAIGSSTLYVGSYATSSSGTTGSVDDFRVYSRVLSLAEVGDLVTFPGVAPLAAHFRRMRAA